MNREGNISLLLVLTAPILIGISSVVINFGNFNSSRIELQRRLDNFALEHRYSEKGSDTSNKMTNEYGFELEKGRGQSGIVAKLRHVSSAYFSGSKEEVKKTISRQSVVQKLPQDVALILPQDNSLLVEDVPLTKEGRCLDSGVNKQVIANRCFNKEYEKLKLTTANFIKFLELNELTRVGVFYSNNTNGYPEILKGIKDENFGFRVSSSLPANRNWEMNKSGEQGDYICEVLSTTNDQWRYQNNLTKCSEKIIKSCERKINYDIFYNECKNEGQIPLSNAVYYNIVKDINPPNDLQLASAVSLAASQLLNGDSYSKKAEEDHRKNLSKIANKRIFIFLSSIPAEGTFFAKELEKASSYGININIVELERFTSVQGTSLDKIKFQDKINKVLEHRIQFFKVKDINDLTKSFYPQVIKEINQVLIRK